MSLIEPHDSGQRRGPVSIRQLALMQSGELKGNHASQQDVNKIHKDDRNQRSLCSKPVSLCFV